MTVGVSCWCGRRAVPGSSGCAKHPPTPRQSPSEAQRVEQQPTRRRYSGAEHRGNRKARYELVGGRCEGCGRPLRGDAFPDGLPWELHHVIDIEDGGDDSIDNARCLCIAKPFQCHYRATARARRSHGK